MGLSKNRVENRCSMEKCTCGQKICKILKDNRHVSTNISRPKPNIERKLVSFSKCWDKNCRPGNKLHYDCQSKYKRHPCQKNLINTCKCPIKHECNCVQVRNSVCKSLTADREIDICGNDHGVVNEKYPKCLTQSVNCGEAFVRKSQFNCSQNPTVEDQAVYIQNTDGLQPVYCSQYTINESARQIVLNLCIDINEQVRFKR